MSENELPSPHYKIVCTGRVSDELRKLMERAVAVHRSGQVMAALLELQRLLSLYPQVGEPLKNLTIEGWTLWHHAFPPLVVKYVIDDNRREVLINAPILTFKNAGLDPTNE